MNDQSPASILDRQKQAFLRDGPPDLAQRRETLKRLAHAVKASADELAEAVRADFGHRSRQETLMADIFPVLSAARHARFHLWHWMRPRHVWPGLELAPSRARIHPQPLGVVGVVSPWNYPVTLALVPLVAALAAGNRVMIKPSELTPRTTETLAEMLGGLFSRGGGRGRRRRTGGRRRLLPRCRSTICCSPARRRSAARSWRRRRKT